VWLPTPLRFCWQNGEVIPQIADNESVIGEGEGDDISVIDGNMELGEDAVGDGA
jgi:hypothetical protein